MTSMITSAVSPRAPWQSTKLSRLSALMCIVVAVGGALAELALIWVWLTPGLVETYVVPRLGLGAAPTTIDGWVRLGGFRALDGADDRARVHAASSLSALRRLPRG